MSNSEAWDYAIDMVKVDDLEPTEELKELIAKEKNGDITKDDILDELNKRYRMKSEG